MLSNTTPRHWPGSRRSAPDRTAGPPAYRPRRSPYRSSAASPQRAARTVVHPGSADSAESACFAWRDLMPGHGLSWSARWNRFRKAISTRCRLSGCFREFPFRSGNDRRLQFHQRRESARSGLSISHSCTVPTEFLIVESAKLSPPRRISCQNLKDMRCEPLY